jgi:hypothetical protein
MFRLALIAFNRGEIRRACGIYLTLLKEDPPGKSQLLHYNIGTCLLKTDHFNEALLHFQ